MEIGMTHCFGGFTREFYKAYHEVYPKAEPAEYYDQRIELYKVRRRVRLECLAFV